MASANAAAAAVAVRRNQGSRSDAGTSSNRVVARAQQIAYPEAIGLHLRALVVIVEGSCFNAADKAIARACLVLCHLLIAQLAELIDDDTENDVQQNDQNDHEEQHVHKEA